MEFGIEKNAMLAMNSGKRCMTGGVELPNQVVIRMLGAKKTYKYLEIVEADTIKQGGAIKKRVSQQNQKITRDKTLLQEPRHRDKYLGCFPRKIRGTIVEVNQIRT